MKILYIIPLLLLLILLINYKKLKRIYRVVNLFKKEKIAWNFINMDKIFDIREVKASKRKYLFPYDLKPLPKEVEIKGEVVDVREKLEETRTTGFLIIKGGKIVHEEYGEGSGPDEKHISWSMAKSFISALFGIAMEEGYIESIEERVEVYVPELIGSGYEGVKIKDVLQMSSGVKFNEDYSDFNSDINRFGRVFAMGRSMDKFSASLVNEKEPGTHNHYVSIDTQVLGMILVRATGRSISEYMQEKLWTKIGTEQSGYWAIDGKEMEVALGGYNATLRDYGKFGYLYLNNGIWQSERIIPELWMNKSIDCSEAHLNWGERGVEGANHFGYGYQWWIPEYPEEGEFFALGVYNQSIYINRARDLVIVKTSANHKFKNNSRVSNKEMIAFIRAIAQKY